MKSIYLRLFLLFISSLLISQLSMANTATESNTELNQHYRKLLKLSPSKLQKEIKHQQMQWLAQRKNNCKVSDSSPSNNDKYLSCFISENKKRITVIKQQTDMLTDLLNVDLIGSDSMDNFKESAFQSLCLCGNNKPWIDNKNGYLLVLNSCEKKKNAQLKYKITGYALNQKYLTINMETRYGEEFAIQFYNLGNHYYSLVLITSDNLELVQVLNFSSYITPIHQFSNTELEYICGDFDG